MQLRLTVQSYLTRVFFNGSRRTHSFMTFFARMHARTLSTWYQSVIYDRLKNNLGNFREMLRTAQTQSKSFRISFGDDWNKGGSFGTQRRLKGTTQRDNNGTTSDGLTCPPPLLLLVTSEGSDLRPRSRLWSCCAAST